MAKKITALIKLQVAAGKANPAPPIGPALGQAGLNIMEFCKQFNAKTQGYEVGMPLPVVITGFADRSFTFIIKTPPMSFLLKKAAGAAKGAADVSRQRVGQVTRAQVQQIAEQKMVDLNAKDIEGAMQMVIGSARSMGIEVVD